MKFYITRHGQPDPSNSPNYFEHDKPLSELGRKQANLLGKHLKDIGFAGKILASPYLRTSETADVIAGELGGKFFLEPIIRERSSPENTTGYTGPTLDQLRQKFTNVSTDALLDYPWWTQNCKQRETDEQGTARVKPLVDKLKSGTKDILLVGHNISALSAIRGLLNKTPEGSKQMMQGNPYWNCGLTIIEANSNSAELVQLCDISYFSDKLITSNWITLDYHRQKIIE